MKMKKTEINNNLNNFKRDEIKQNNTLTNYLESVQLLIENSKNKKDTQKFFFDLH
jgi:hypothetical protein